MASGLICPSLQLPPASHLLMVVQAPPEAGSEQGGGGGPLAVAGHYPDGAFWLSHDAIGLTARTEAHADSADVGGVEQGSGQVLARGGGAVLARWVLHGREVWAGVNRGPLRPAKRGQHRASGDEEGTAAAGAPGLHLSATPFTVGGAGPASAFGGRVAEVLLFARALSPDEEAGAVAYLNRRWFGGALAEPATGSAVDTHKRRASLHERAPVEPERLGVAAPGGMDGAGSAVAAGGGAAAAPQSLQEEDDAHYGGVDAIQWRAPDDADEEARKAFEAKQWEARARIRRFDQGGEALRNMIRAERAALAEERRLRFPPAGGSAPAAHYSTVARSSAAGGEHGPQSAPLAADAREAQEAERAAQAERQRARAEEEEVERARERTLEVKARVKRELAQPAFDWEPPASLVGEANVKRFATRRLELIEEMSRFPGGGQPLREFSAKAERRLADLRIEILSSVAQDAVAAAHDPGNGAGAQEEGVVI